mmetsp:Transcript_27476/g.60461  ORF Transcript_27476/g.60461 Transcript_27476/m.60461 type:complete len:129 (-) Transcript_27476:87-473(-)
MHTSGSHSRFMSRQKHCLALLQSPEQLQPLKKFTPYSPHIQCFVHKQLFSMHEQLLASLQLPAWKQGKKKGLDISCERIRMTSLIFLLLLNVGHFNELSTTGVLTRSWLLISVRLMAFKNLDMAPSKL